jgi:hypothetical protein
MNNRSAVIVGCLKNSAPYLEGVLKNIDMISSLFEKVSYVFIENDSADETKKIMREWGKSRDNFYFHNMDGLDKLEKSRTVRLEIARNAYIHIIKNNEVLRNSDFMIVLDMDDISSFPLSIDQFKNGIDYLRSRSSIAGVFPNQLHNYYDLWALRHPQLCSGDFWQAILLKTLQGQSDESAFEGVSRTVLKKIPLNYEPIQVESAFGGLGIYRMSFVIRNRAKYLGSEYLFTSNDRVSFMRMQVCEHVNFNSGLINLGGELYILPYLINSINLISLNKSSHTSLIISSHE